MDYYEDKDKLWMDEWFDMFRKGPWARSRDCSFVQTMNPEFDSYHPYSCNTCKRGSLQTLSLLRCSGCKIMKYCCKSHQKKDWPGHKKWCKAYNNEAIRHGDNNIEDSVTTHKEWIGRQNEINVSLVSSLENIGHQNELQIAGLQPHCRRCFRSGRLPGIDLVVCPSCSGVAVCRPCLGDAHSDSEAWEVFHSGDKVECESYLIYLCCSGMIVERDSPIISASATNCTEMFHPKDWVEYFEKKGNDFDKGVYPISALLCMAPVTCFLTECLTMPHTINMFIGKLGLLNKPNLCIHILGADLAEVAMTTVLVELGRLNPQLKRVDLVMVGPKMPRNFSFSYTDFSQPRRGFPNEVPCHLNGAIEHVVGLYHNSVAVCGRVPDFFVAFNSGIHDPSHFVNWKPTLELVKTRSGSPLCITGFNYLEVQKDANILKQMGFQEMKPPTANPFRSMRPFLDPAREETDFYYGNKAYAILQGS